MSGWVHDGNRVFNGAAPTSWTDLDLKAIAGGGSTSHPSGRTLALLKVVNGAGWSYMAFRPNGTSYDTYVNQPDGHGCCMCTPNNATSDAALVLVQTDSAGIVEWQAQANDATEIWLVGFVEATTVDLTVRSDSAMPSTWTSLDLTQDVVATPTGLSAEALVFLWVERTGGTSNYIATRPRIPGYANFLGSGVLGGCSQGEINNATEYEAYAQKTSSTGDIEIIAATVVPNTEITLASFEEDGFDNFNIEVFAAAQPPTSWTSLDLSTQVGSRRALVMLQVHHENAAPGGLQGVAFRATGDTGDYLPGNLGYPMGVACCGLDADDRTIVITETASDGTVEWISSSTARDIDIRIVGVLGENDPPVVQNWSPTGTGISPTQNIYFEVTDDTQVLQNTIDLDITLPGGSSPTSIIANGVFQAPYTGTIAANGSNGFDVTVDDIPMIVGVWDATVYCEDASSESATQNWNWTVTADAPEISNNFPTDTVLELEKIRFTITDDYGMDESTLVIRAIPSIGVPLTVYTGSAFQTGWSGYIVESGAIYGSDPTKIEIAITEFPEDFLLSSPKRWTIESTIDSIVAVTM